MPLVPLLAKYADDLRFNVAREYKLGLVCNQHPSARRQRI